MLGDFTSNARDAELEAHIVEQHPWDMPEVSAVELVRGSSDYVRWLEQVTISEA
ncbi:divalent cation tolerance protein CutA [Amycolatopsis sp. RTGN1]|uniref:divalent cation tolerance protein CutA n=1 Tax=Amycolatopsis ponsaeliensis TaxID=2992142 RepID=UPI00254B241D|nr:divalent cation tolerance protein CutA [Amycolatopsis sp. RTGN1]